MNTARRIIVRRHGFTLIELLVVVGILALLLSILTPMLMVAYRSAGRTRLKADMATIAGALEEYKKDFGDYPRVDTPNTGFAVLGRALLGTYGDGVTGNPPVNDPNDPPTYVGGTLYFPGDCVQAGGTGYVALVQNPVSAPNPGAEWAVFTATDLLDGFGTRLRQGGKKVGPYVQPEKFRIHGCAFVDSNDKPILYFPARQAKPNLSVMLQPSNTPPFLNLNAYGPNALGVQQNLSLFNANDNLQFFMRVDDTLNADATWRIGTLLGDNDRDGMIDNGEQAATTGPFLLWAPGPDGFYGPVTHPSTNPPGTVEIGKCDDVTNFR